MQLPKHFSNHTPFLLFPVRLETRFKTVADPLARREIHQLWVRIYPDTCMVDSFDPQLSAQELRNVARFWAEFYAAGQIADEDNPDPKTLEMQQAAWAFLAKTGGCGPCGMDCAITRSSASTGFCFSASQYRYLNHTYNCHRR